MKIEILPVTGNQFGVVTGHPAAPRIHAEAPTLDEAMFFAKGMQSGHALARQQLEPLTVSYAPLMAVQHVAPIIGKVWLLQSEHWHVPGLVQETYASEIDAKRAAAALVNELRGDCITGEPGLPQDADETNFEMKMDEARMARAVSMGFEPDAEGGEDPGGWLDGDNDNADVWITEQVVKGSIAPAPLADDFRAKVAAIHIPDDDFAFADDAERDAYIDTIGDGVDTAYMGELFKIVREARAK